MVRLEYFTGEIWVECGVFSSDATAWISLGDDNLDYRTVYVATGEVVTDKSRKEPM